MCLTFSTDDLQVSRARLLKVDFVGGVVLFPKPLGDNTAVPFRRAGVVLYSHPFSSLVRTPKTHTQKTKGKKTGVQREKNRGQRGKKTGVLIFGFYSTK